MRQAYETLKYFLVIIKVMKKLNKHLIYVFMLAYMPLLYAAPADDFVITVQTDNIGVSADTEFTIPITNTNGNGYNVDCNDDGTDEATGIIGNSSYTCVYGTAGTYTIRVKDNNADKKGFRRIRFYINSTTTTDVKKLISIEQWGTAIWSSMVTAFRDAINMTVPAIDKLDLSEVGSLSSMFYNCTLANPNTSDWNISNISNLSYMFRDASNANPDVSLWNTSNVSRMNSMFQNAEKAIPNTSAWDTSLVTRMDNMFQGAILAEPITSNWVTSNVLEMDYMFRDAINSNPDVSNWDTSKVTTMSNMFYNADKAEPVTATNGNIWNTSSVINMTHMFRKTALADPDTSNWDTSNVTTMESMFQGTTLADPDTGSWDTSNVLNMKNLFRDATKANPDVSNWDTINVMTMFGMFYNADKAEPVTATNGNSWNTSSVTDMSHMFRGAALADPDVSGWDTSALEKIIRMFQNANSFDQNMSSWDVSNVTDASSFLNGVQLTQANYDALLTSWGSQAVQNAVTFHGGTSQYCSGKPGRDALLSNSWSITDGGKNCGGVCASAVGSLTEDHWVTISFPCSTGSNGIEALIGTAIGGDYGDSDNWVVYEQRGDYSGTSDSMVLLDANDTVEPGKGYWLIADHNTTWHIDGSLSDLDFSPTVTASSLSIIDLDFDYVNLRNLPDTTTEQQKLLLGNPFPSDINISDIYFSGAGNAFSPMDGNVNNDPYVNDVIYTYDHEGNVPSAYKALSAATPGFDSVLHQQGFWLRLKPGQSGTNQLTYPLPK